MNEQYKNWKIYFDEKLGEWVAQQNGSTDHVLSDQVYGDLKKRIDERNKI